MNEKELLGLDKKSKVIDRLTKENEFLKGELDYYKEMLLLRDY